MLEVDITESPKLEALYGHEVPVVLIDGKKRFIGQVDAVLLRRILDRDDPKAE